MLWLVVVAALVGMSAAHPAHMEKAYLANVNCSAAPEILSYHVHIVFMQFNKDMVAAVSQLRQEIEQHFAPLLGPNPRCSTAEDGGRYDNGRLCMIYDHDIGEILIGGPFPVGEFSIFVPVAYYGIIVPYFLQHRGEFSLLVHPNTGCEYEDHSIWAMWAGQAFPLDLYGAGMVPLTQTNEFNETLSGHDNPVCLDAGMVCGRRWPELVCCAGQCVRDTGRETFSCRN